MTKENFIVKSFVLSDKDKWLDMEAKLPVDALPKKMQWIHMECDNINTKKWLYEQRDIEEIVIESLLAEDTRPRITSYTDGHFINLRGINLNSEEDPHDMISIRIFIQNHRIISTSKKQLHAVDDLEKLLKSDNPPVTAGGVMVAILELLVDRAEQYIIELKESTYDLEYKIIDEANLHNRRQITEIRRAVITLTRYFSPQKDAATKLLSVKGTLFSLVQERAIMECINKLSKFIEDLESLDNRCYVLQDEVVAITNDKINKNMYYISVLATFFLPLTFLTGLFGVNLGGIPMAASKFGFYKFCGVLVLMLIVQGIILLKSRRF